MSGKDAALAIEICSGPLDGTGAQVSGGSFTIGHDATCDLSLPETPGTPSKAVVTFSVGAGGAVKLESECEFEREGSTTRTVEGDAGTVLVRVGTTDIAVRVAAVEEPAAPAGGSQTNETKPCPKCGAENASGARWCANCGRDL